MVYWSFLGGRWRSKQAVKLNTTACIIPIKGINTAQILSLISKELELLSIHRYIYIYTHTQKSTLLDKKLDKSISLMWLYERFSPGFFSFPFFSSLGISLTKQSERECRILCFFFFSGKENSAIDNGIQAKMLIIFGNLKLQVLQL
jgi:hypothetical protein